jgi:hypothetical protein
VVMIGPVPVQLASTETVCTPPRLSRTFAERAADTHVLEVRVELRGRRLHEAQLKVPSGHWPTKPTLRGGLGARVVPASMKLSVSTIRRPSAAGGAIRALERDQPTGEGNFLCEAVRGQCDGRHDKHRRGAIGRNLPAEIVRCALPLSVPRPGRLLTLKATAGRPDRAPGREGAHDQERPRLSPHSPEPVPRT